MNITQNKHRSERGSLSSKASLLPSHFHKPLNRFAAGEVTGLWRGRSEQGSFFQLQVFSLGKGKVVDDFPFSVLGI